MLCGEENAIVDAGRTRAREAMSSRIDVVENEDMATASNGHSAARESYVQTNFGSQAMMCARFDSDGGLRVEDRCR